MTIKERIERILEYFRNEMPDAKTELNYENTFQLLIAVMLSAQCTDNRVNKVTPHLFSKYPTVFDLAIAEIQEVLSYISSVSYPNSKARHIIESSKIIADKFGGNVPDNIDELLSLPGVGRKTANVILSIAFGQTAIAVDTHVYRVSHRLGLVTAKDNTPDKVEKKLIKHIPAKDIHIAHHWLLLHGRYVCKSNKPHCEECGLNTLCPKLLANSKL